MKTKEKSIALFGIAFLTFQVMLSQTYIDNKLPKDPMVLASEGLNPLALANLGLDFSGNPKTVTTESSSVFLEQIGDYNQADIRTQAQSSEITLIQKGNDNYTSLNYTARTAIADLEQNGNGNIIRDHVNDPMKDISLELVQDGNYLNFEREGVNELTKSLKFRQTEASPSLIIRSYP